MSNVYAIVDLVGYASQMREAAAKSLCNNHNDNLDNYISIDQMIGLVKHQCVGFDEENRPLLDEQSNSEIFDQTTVWIHNVGLAKLAAQNLIECAWDDKSNEMIFWVNETKKDKSSNEKNKRNKRKN